MGITTARRSRVKSRVLPVLWSRTVRVVCVPASPRMREEGSMPGSRGTPSTDRMRSPADRPASWAGEPSSTERICTPSLTVVWMDTPMPTTVSPSTWFRKDWYSSAVI